MWSFPGGEEGLSSKTDVLLYNHEYFIIISFVLHWLWPMWLAGKATSEKEKSPHFFSEGGVQRNPAFLSWIENYPRLFQPAELGVSCDNGHSQAL